MIMGGGIGSRFWPFSRKTLPKQFLDFFGTGRSLLQQTFDRFSKVIPAENIFIARRHAKSEPPNPLFKVQISISSAYFSTVETMADFFNRIGQKRSFRPRGLRPETAIDAKDLQT